MGNRLRGDFLRRGRCILRNGVTFLVCRARDRSWRAQRAELSPARPAPLTQPLFVFLREGMLRRFRHGDWRHFYSGNWRRPARLLAPPSLPSLAFSRRALLSLSQNAPPAPRRALDDPDDLDALDERRPPSTRVRATSTHAPSS